jgi:3-methyladenine DNA glycosylase AlkD
MSDIAKQIIKAIKTKQNAEKSLWLQNYVKHEIKSFGVGIPEIREIIKQIENDQQLNNLPTNVQIEFLNDLMENKYTEPKLGAILYIQLFWKKTNGVELLRLSTNWFDKNWITDWNVCDWLCVRLLTPLLDKEPEITVSVLKEWNKSMNLWKARASLVPFAQSKNIEKYSKTILQFSEKLIKREERFCKTSVGWVLREYSKKDNKFVIDFLEQNKEWTTKEVIKNATKYIEQK